MHKPEGLQWLALEWRCDYQSELSGVCLWEVQYPVAECGTQAQSAMFRAQGSGPATLLIFTLSSVFLTSAVETDSGRSSGGRVDLTADFVEEINASIKSIKLIWQSGLTHDVGAPAFVACTSLDCFPHIFGDVGVEVSLQSLLMSQLWPP